MTSMETRRVLEMEMAHRKRHLMLDVAGCGDQFGRLLHAQHDWHNARQLTGCILANRARADV